ncbi:MAG: hypothetical protein M3404_02370 [Actinomycetota bacterium]|nr:hypothetical protein [Actinomycetota bacterium]
MTARTYRFAPRDRTGWVLGLSGPQVLTLGAALLVGVFASSNGMSVLISALPVIAGAGVAFGRLGGRPLLEAGPPALAWAMRAARHRTRWQAQPSAEVQLGAAGEEKTDEDPKAPRPLALPPPLDGQEVMGVDAGAYDASLAGGHIAVIHDPRTRTYAVTVPAVGTQFALTEREEQEHLLALWGDALAGFCQEKGPVSFIRWAEWAAPAGMGEQLAYLAEHGHADPGDPAVASYRSLLASAGPMSTRHEVLLTVAVAADKVTSGRRHRGDERAACIEALLAQVRLFVARMEAAGLVVGHPLSAEELEQALWVRLDPGAVSVVEDRPRGLAQRAGVVPLAGRTPTTADAAFAHWSVDGSLHRSFYVAEWPRLQVGPDWMQALVLWASAVRSLAVVYEPVPPRRSQRAIHRDATKLASDEDHRRSRGFRISAHHRRAQADVEEREAELVSGYAELAYTGVVSVAAPDADGLERACDRLVQVAAGCQIQLQPLDGRHDQAAAACLPLARALAPARVA